MARKRTSKNVKNSEIPQGLAVEDNSELPQWLTEENNSTETQNSVESWPIDALKLDGIKFFQEINPVEYKPYQYSFPLEFKRITGNMDEITEQYIEEYKEMEKNGANNNFTVDVSSDTKKVYYPYIIPGNTEGLYLYFQEGRLIKWERGQFNSQEILTSGDRICIYKDYLIHEDITTLSKNGNIEWGTISYIYKDREIHEFIEDEKIVRKETIESYKFFHGKSVQEEGIFGEKDGNSYLIHGLKTTMYENGKLFKERIGTWKEYEKDEKKYTYIGELNSEGKRSGYGRLRISAPYVHDDILFTGTFEDGYLIEGLKEYNRGGLRFQGTFDKNNEGKLIDGIITNSVQHYYRQYKQGKLVLIRNMFLGKDRMSDEEGEFIGKYGEEELLSGTQKIRTMATQEILIEKEISGKIIQE